MRRQVIIRDDYTCQYCGKRADRVRWYDGKLFFNNPNHDPKMYQIYGCTSDAPRIPLEFDHIIPLSKGGGDTVDNLTIACKRCNGRKGASHSLV